MHPQTKSWLRLWPICLHTGPFRSRVALWHLTKVFLYHAGPSYLREASPLGEGVGLRFRGFYLREASLWLGFRLRFVGGLRRLCAYVNVRVTFWQPAIVFNHLGNSACGTNNERLIKNGKILRPLATFRTLTAARLTSPSSAFVGVLNRILNFSVGSSSASFSTSTAHVTVVTPAVTNQHFVNISVFIFSEDCYSAEHTKH